VSAKHHVGWALGPYAFLPLCLLSLTGACADVQLPAIIGDSMVLQRGLPIRIWGDADPGEQVSVGLAGHHGVATASSGGTWRTSLPAMEAGGPFDLTITGSNCIVVHDVMIGEVWVCAGQSNMRLPVERCSDSTVEIANATRPDIRLFTVDDPTASVPPEEVVDRWLPCSPETVGPFSGAAYFFGRYLHEALGVPIGLIESAVDSSPVERWTSLSALQGDPDIGPAMGQWPSAIRPGELFEAMVRPLVPYRIRGVVWYQGEANVRRAYQYRKLFPTLIRDWRTRWGQGDFPFLYVQLSTYLARESVPSESYWAELREAQLMALAVPNTAQAVAVDIGDGANLHPPNKQDVGRRLGMAALGTAYGWETPVSGPLYSSMHVSGITAVISFTHTDGGLLAGGGGPLVGFAIAGGDRRFYWADATISGSTVRVLSECVPAPVAVRYAWASNPECNLYGGALLPASPFRTDDWPVLTTSDYQPSAVIHNGATYVGSSIYNTTGVNQTHTQSAQTDAQAIYHVRFYNGGARSDTFRITGPGGNATWRVAYYDHDTGADITSAVTATGWLTPSLAVDSYQRVRIEVTPLSRAAPDASLSVLAKATSVADGTRQDAVKAVTTCLLTRRPDGKIHDGTAYIGDGILNTTGAGQTHSRTASPNTVAGYLIRFYNDGNAPDTFRITGATGDSAWQVKYLDYRTGIDLTSSVTGAGWVPPPIAARAYCSLRLEVAALWGAAASATFSALVTGTSLGDTKEKDAVKAVTTCALARKPDAMIHNGTTFIGDDVLNTSGAGQMHSRTARSYTVAAYLTRFYNDGNAADSIRITGPASNWAWRLKCTDYSTGTDITSAVTGAGWTTPPLAVRGYHAVRLEVTPLAGAAGNSTLAVLLKGTSVGDASKRDAVRADTTCAPTYQPDGLIYDGTAYIGDGVCNTSGHGQTHALPATPRGTATYHIYFYNDGNVVQPLVITGTAGNSRWAVQYLDYATGMDVTAAVTGAGWSTPALSRSAGRRLRVLVTPGPSVLEGETRSLLVTSTSAVDATKKDAVKAITTCAPSHRPHGRIYSGTAYVRDGDRNTGDDGRTRALSIALGPPPPTTFTATVQAKLRSGWRSQAPTATESGPCSIWAMPGAQTPPPPLRVQAGGRPPSALAPAGSPRDAQGQRCCRLGAQPWGDGRLDGQPHQDERSGSDDHQEVADAGGSRALQTSSGAPAARVTPGRGQGALPAGLLAA